MTQKLFQLLFAAGCLMSVAAQPLPTMGKRAKLFNGKNLDGWDVFLASKGLNNDPEQVFRVVKKEVVVSGAESGYLATKQEFSDFYLTCEFRWGQATFDPRRDKARDSGILFRAQDDNRIWPQSLEFQFQEGGTGDIWLVGRTSASFSGEPKQATETNYTRIDRLGKGPWRDELGYRDPIAELEEPHGQWNKVALLAVGDTIRYWVNGKLANEATRTSITKGRILFQSEGAEVAFRNIVIRPVLQK